MSLDDIREAFAAAAPDQELERFFRQWLDRAGAPRFEVAWSPPDGERVEIVLTQPEGGEPFSLDLEIELTFAEHEPRRVPAEIRGRDTKLVVEVPAPVVGVELDPDRELLLWRPAYEAPPRVSGIELSPTASWLTPEAYVGTYELAEFGERSEVYVSGDELWARSGEDVHRLWPYVPHRFRARSGWVEFHLEDGRATSFTLELDGGTVAEGIRVD